MVMPDGPRRFAAERADGLGLHPRGLAGEYRGVRYSMWQWTPLKPGSTRLAALFLPAVDSPVVLSIDDRYQVVDASEVTITGDWDWYVLHDETAYLVNNLLEGGLVVIAETQIERVDGLESLGFAYNDPFAGYGYLVPWDGAVVREVWVARGERRPRVIGGLPVG